ncbi:MAG TPA: phosphoribosylaminoimidazolesuccinocarboxamide synthase, partial [Thermoanaerobaculia bacterium]|nr:phosphoribosylaminoimidazolesuccinocarboxamide synthase [Thermoanaerobaculia bacterium]
DTWKRGSSPPSYDKQFVRDFLEKTGWNKTPPAPVLPPDVVAGTRARYIEAFEKLTGAPFEG